MIKKWLTTPAGFFLSICLLACLTSWFLLHVFSSNRLSFVAHFVNFIPSFIIMNRYCSFDMYILSQWLIHSAWNFINFIALSILVIGSILEDHKVTIKIRKENWPKIHFIYFHFIVTAINYHIVANAMTTLTK